MFHPFIHTCTCSFSDMVNYCCACEHQARFWGQSTEAGARPGGARGGETTPLVAAMGLLLVAGTQVGVRKQQVCSWGTWCVCIVGACAL